MKNAFSAVAGVGVIVATIIPLVVPVSDLAPWWPWKAAILGACIVAAASIIAQAILQSHEDQARRLGEAHHDKILQLAEAALMGNASPAKTVPAAASPDDPSTLNPGDPRIYPEVTNDPATGLPRTEIILRNHGGEVAHNVQVSSLRFASATAEFKTIATIAPGKDQRVVPEIDGAGVLQRHDLTYLLMREWDSCGELRAEFVRPVEVTYQDYAKRAFRTTFELVYLPINEITNRNHPSSSARPVLEIRNVEFSRCETATVGS